MSCSCVQCACVRMITVCVCVVSLNGDFCSICVADILSSRLNLPDAVAAKADDIKLLQLRKKKKKNERSFFCLYPLLFFLSFLISAVT